MPHVNNLNFPEYTFTFEFLHTIEDNFGKQKQNCRCLLLFFVCV